MKWPGAVAAAPGRARGTSTPVSETDRTVVAGSAPLARPRRRECLRRGCPKRFAPPPRQGEVVFCGEPDCESALECWRRAKGPHRDRFGSLEAPLDFGARLCAEEGCEETILARSPTHSRCARCSLERRRLLARERQRRRRAAQRDSELAVDDGPSSACDLASPPPQVGGGAALEAAQASCHAPHETCRTSSFCDRPGCYEPPRAREARGPSYCAPPCARAIRRALDRRRRWAARQAVKVSGAGP